MRKIICAAIVVLAGCSAAQTNLPSGSTSLARPAASKAQILYSFTGGNDGGDAATGLVFDSKGNLYGSTVIGGKYTCGTVFELTAKSKPPWPESVLYNFGCYADGKSPHGGVTFDKSGNLYGTTVAGGTGGYCASDGCGTLYRLTSKGESVLHNFSSGKDGFGPGGGVIFDRAGAIYGTTPDGGKGNEGVIYQVSSSGHEKILHAFTGGKDGGVGSLGLLLLHGSALYGVTEIGGANNAGTVYRLSGSKLTTLYAFKGTPDAGSPYGGLIADKPGNLYGTTYYGGAGNLGSVFELIAGKHGYHERVIYSFAGGNDGSSPTSTLLLDNSGNLYGTTSAGGGYCNCGTVFKVGAKSGKEQVLYAFGGSGDGAYPYYGLVADRKGDLYGTTVSGGAFYQGTVFEIAGAL